jgi:predicted esterase
MRAPLERMARRRNALARIGVVTIAALLARSAAAGDGPALASLVDRLLASDEGRARRKAAERITAHPQWDFEQVYRELREGRRYPADAAVGVIEGARRNRDGVLHPYLLIVPKSYDPRRHYPVRVYLHGGVGRPAWDGEAKWWPDAARLLDEGRIAIVPAAWRDSTWWQASQVESLTAILREVKRRYDVDENRVSLIGRSDGGTGAWYFALHAPTPWASYLPFVGSPIVLMNPESGAEGAVFLPNAMGKSFLVINGSADRLYPAETLRPLMAAFSKVGADVTFEVEEGGGHDTRWWPRRAGQIDAFVESHPRDPSPDHVFWATDRAEGGGRAFWLVIDALAGHDDCEASDLGVLGKPPRRCGAVDATRKGNVFDVTTSGVDRYRLLLSPEKVDLDAEVIVRTNGQVSHRGRVERSLATLLEWAAEDVDRTMLFAAEIAVTVPRQAPPAAAPDRLPRPSEGSR